MRRRYQDVVLFDEPIGYWRLGDTSSPAIDASGHGAQGTYGTGVSVGVPGAIVEDTDTAVSFNGSSGAISVGAGFNFLEKLPFSIEAWIKPSALDGEFRHVFTKEHRTTPRAGYGLLVRAEGLSFERFVDDVQNPASYPTLPSTSSFTHVVATYDSAFMRLYVNGQQVVQVSEDRNALTAVEELAWIGAASSTQAIFNGAIDEVAVYAAALPADRVQAHYLAGTQP